MILMAKGLPASIAKKYGITKKAWSVYRGGRKASKSGSATMAKNRKRSVRRYVPKRVRSGGKAILGKYGATGLVEDAAIGYLGGNLFMGMGYPLASALPMARVAQGAAGMALNRRGKGRLAYGIIDLMDVYLINKGFNFQKISLSAWR